MGATTAKGLMLFCVGVLFCNSSLCQIDFSNLSAEQIYTRSRNHNNWFVSFGGGPVVFYADVIDYSVFPSHHLQFAPSFIISRQFGRPWGLDAQFLKSNMYGEKNDRYFKGDLYDFTLNLRFSVNQLVAFGPVGDRWDFYGKVGLGMVAFRSRQQSLIDKEILGEPIAADQYLRVKHVYPFISGYPSAYGWDDEDYLAFGYNRSGGLPIHKESRQVEIVVPFGIGIKYRVSNSFDIGLEVLMRKVAADNLDVNLSGADNDSYMSALLEVSYKIGKKNKRHARWTYKDFNLTYSQKRKYDPLAERLDSLKKVLAELAIADSVVADTSWVFREEVVYEEGISTSVFFDFDKAIVNKRGKTELARVARVMNRNPDLRLRLVGYCDERGADNYNVKLSLRRCHAVLDVLSKDYGLAAERFQINPMGETNLLSDTRSLKPRGLHLVNRRVDILMVVEE